MASTQDPFYVVKEEVLQSFNGISSLYERWKELLTSTNTATNEEFKFTMNELQSGIKSIEWDLTDLEETISIVESNKSKFKIDDAELRSRKGFIAEIRRKTAAMKDDLNSAKTKGILERDQRELLMKQKSGPTGDKFSRLEAAIEHDNDDYIQNQQQRQDQIYRQQDQDLTQLSHTITNLKKIGEDIGSALKEHDGLIIDIEEGVGKADTGLKGAIKKVNDLIDSTRDSTQWCIIITLILVLVGLAFLVYYL